MNAVPASAEIELEGRRFRLSNLDKVLWREAGFTKGQMIDYYTEVAPALLPHLAGRAVALRRFPDGVEGVSWYQFQWPRGHPRWLRSGEVAGRSRETWHFCLVGDLSSLAWAANLGAVELHPYLARADRPHEPTVVVFDLDPGPGAEVLDCCRAAVRLRDALAGLGLVSFAKTSGSLGLHVYVPLNAGHGFRETKAFARTLARRLAAAHPDLVVAEPRRSARAGKVLVDWAQNNAARSTVAVYSLRATPWPTVSAPVTWDEIEQAVGRATAYWNAHKHPFIWGRRRRHRQPRRLGIAAVPKLILI